MTKEEKEKMLVKRAYDIDDLASFNIYIRIELQRNRHTIDADRRLSFSVSFLSVAFSISNIRRYFLFYFYVLLFASFDATIIINNVRHYIERVLAIRVI